MPDLSHLPDWPRWMSDDVAAAYVGVSTTRFLEEVEAGTWPKPTKRASRVVRWDRALLDRASDRESGIAVTTQAEAERRALEIINAG